MPASIRSWKNNQKSRFRETVFDMTEMPWEQCCLENDVLIMYSSSLWWMALSIGGAVTLFMRDKVFLSLEDPRAKWFSAALAPLEISQSEPQDCCIYSSLSSVVKILFTAPWAAPTSPPSLKLPFIRELSFIRMWSEWLRELRSCSADEQDASACQTAIFSR
jgi:hypothetical protein